MPPFFQRNLRTNFHFSKRIYKFSSTFPKLRRVFTPFQLSAQVPSRNLHQRLLLARSPWLHQVRRTQDERRILEAKRLISDLLEERTTLESDGRFHTYPEYPEFAWVESITNAVCHRQWGLREDYILVAKYDDRLEIKSPGRLPNIVTVDNIFTTRFARNPLISRVLTEMELVRELNEGIPRVFKEMKDAGLPEPKIVETAANVTVVLYNGKTANTSDNSSDNHLPENLSVNLSVTQQKILRMIAENQYINATYAAEILQISRNSVNAAISVLKEKGLIVRIGEDKGGYWEIIKR